MCITVALAIFWTVLREELTPNVFMVRENAFSTSQSLLQPFAERLKLEPASNARKMPESLWKLAFYSSTWLYSAYLLILSGHNNYFYDPLSVWDGAMVVCHSFTSLHHRLVANNEHFI